MAVLGTVSMPGAVETDITGKTDLVGNGDFLLVVFGEVIDARPVVVCFEGNLGSVPPRIWFGRPWQSTPDMTARPSVPTIISVSRSSGPTTQVNSGGRRRAFTPCTR